MDASLVIKSCMDLVSHDLRKMRGVKGMKVIKFSSKCGKYPCRRLKKENSVQEKIKIK
jgi:hypothetical protein